MPNPHDVAACVGSLRRESFTRRIAIALGTLAPAELKLEIVEIGSVSCYNEDLETGNPPAEWTRLRAGKARGRCALSVARVSQRAHHAAAGGVRRRRRDARGREGRHQQRRHPRLSRDLPEGLRRVDRGAALIVGQATFNRELTGC